MRSTSRARARSRGSLPADHRLKPVLEILDDREGLDEVAAVIEFEGGYGAERIAGQVFRFAMPALDRVDDDLLDIHLHTEFCPLGNVEHDLRGVHASGTM